MAAELTAKVQSQGFGPVRRIAVRMMAALVLPIILSPPAAADVVISEIMYHPYHPVPGAEDIKQEWIELFNDGTSPVTMTGWQFNDGVSFVFPAVELGPGQRLVVAADVAAFTAAHPGVTHVVGGWNGWLSNSGETITLVNEGGEVIDSIRYADEGDWAVRELGPVDHSHRGWQWSSPADGGGMTLELVNAALPNEMGQNWAAGAVDGGTPGRANSVAASDAAPLIAKVRQKPAIPGPGDSVAVTARVVDESASGLTVQVRYCTDRSAYAGSSSYPQEHSDDFTSVEMLDDGGHHDGFAGDGVYGGSIPPQPDGAVIEFYIQAVDRAGLIRTWPAPSLVDGEPLQVTNALYRVDASFDPDTYWTIGGQPLYYVVMTEMERGRLAYIGRQTNGQEDSDATMNGTFVSLDGAGIELRYRSGIRNRGHGTRSGPPNNFHVGFTSDDPWKDVGAINFNCRDTHAQIIGSALFHMAGMAVADTTPAQLRVNGGSPMSGAYARLEAFDGDFAQRHFPDDPNGNLYSCFRDNGEADLRYLGTKPASYRPSYFKESNVSADDWSDLIHMTDVLNNAPDATYLQEVSQVINVSQWLHYIALDSLLLNCETGLRQGIGDDYFMYCGVADPRFVLIPHDLDTILDQGNAHGGINQSVFSIVDGGVSSQGNGVDGLKRFLTHPDIAPLYYQALLDMANGAFSPEKLDPLLDRVLGGFTPASRIDAMKQFARNRRAAVLAQIPQALTITSAPPMSGDYAGTTSGEIVLGGQANAARTRRVTVAGKPAVWTPAGAQWTTDGVPLVTGINHVIIQAFDANDVELERTSIDIWFGRTSPVTKPGGAIGSDQVWTAAGGPYHVTGTVIVPAGRTLTLEPGTTLLFDSGAGITVYGRLLAEGTPNQWITLTRMPMLGTSWAGLQFRDTGQESRLAYVNMQYADSGPCAIQADNAAAVIMDHIDWSRHTKPYLIFQYSSLALKNSVLPGIQNTELVHFSGMPTNGYALFEGNRFGGTTGYNDIIDFSGGRRPGPIARFIGNTFTVASSGCIDLDDADAHVEGNVFMHVHENGAIGSDSHAVAVGAAAAPCEVMVVRNLFYDVDYALLCEDGGFITAVNNTVVRAAQAVVDIYAGQTQGFYGDGNIFWDVPRIFENRGVADPLIPITLNRSIFPVLEGDPVVWSGSGNLENVDPQLIADASVADPRHDLQLLPSSPAVGAGPNGRDMGGLIPPGASISGEPLPVTWRTTATLDVGGPDIYAYKYRVNAGPWSEEIAGPGAALAGDPKPLPPIVLTGLQNGQSYTVYVIGKDSAGAWQSEDAPTASHAWTVDTSYRYLVINEVLADNQSVPTPAGGLPDMVELHYDGPTAMSLAGMHLSDDPADPNRFAFPADLSIQPGEHLVLYADSDTTTPGLHLGFALDADGEILSLYDKAGAVVDSVEFGPQAPDLSIGRAGSADQWHLTIPTFGRTNVSHPLGDPRSIRISEWLAAEEVLFDADFIELYNPGALPVDLGGFGMTDAEEFGEFVPRLSPLTIVPGEGFLVLTADGLGGPGAVDFKLSSGGDKIALLDPDLQAIDRVLFGPQTTDVSQGRCPEDSEILDYLVLPTPGLSNPIAPERTIAAIDLVPQSAPKRAIVPTSATEVGDAWRSDVGFNDSSWLTTSGLPGGVGYERNSGYEGFISLDVQSQMYSKYTTCYIRIPFSANAEQIAALSGLILSVRHDDGFIAYLNGTEVGRVGLTGTPAWNSASEVSHEASAQGFDFTADLSSRMDLLRPGDNLLAVQGLNESVTSSDFIIAAVLTGTIVHVENGGPYPYTEQLKLLEDLRITELMYNPSQGDRYEYVELQNVGNETLDLTGVRFVDGIEFTFPSMALAPQQYVVVVNDPAAFRSAYGSGINVAGQYTGKLSNGGENLVLSLPAPLEAAIMRFHYRDAWYPATDGGGTSLMIVDPAANPAAWNDPENWRPASPTPGRP